MEFQFYLPVRVVAGPQAVRRCGPRFAALGKKCLIVTGRHAAAACGALGDVTEALHENGVSWELFDEVGENPLLSDCVRAAALCRACGASFVVGIGGGSPMDAAKAIALLAANPQITGDDLYTAADRHPALPIALVGTTSGTGSEVSAAAVLTDSTGRKKSVKGDDLYAAFAAADAKYTFTLSRAATISTGLDALCHAMEGYLSPKCDPISAGFAELCLPDLWKNLLALWQGEALTEARHRVLYGASIQAGFVLNTVGTSFPHPLGYVLTERFGVPHGRACAAFAASLLDLALERGEERAERFLQVIGAERQLFVRVMDSLAGCGDLRLSEEEIASLRTRLTKVKNYANVPGGFDEDQALALLRRLFGTQTRIYLVRHCESTGNSDHIFQGRVDCGVSENGQKQLDLLSVRLRNVKLDAMVSSPLSRAVRTAEAVNRFHHLPVETCADLIEIDGGGYDGLHWEDLPARFPEQNENWYHHPARFEAPDGETMKQVYDRVWRGLLHVVETHRGQTVCVVSHGCALRNLLCRLLYGTIDRLGDTPWCENTGVTIVDFAADNTARIRLLDDASHLTPETASLPKQPWWGA